MNIYNDIIKVQEQNKDFAVLTIIKSEGSVARHENSKMIVSADSGIIGTIGGGIIEKKSIDEAIKQIKIGQSKVIELQKDSKTLADLVCGGAVEVFIEVHKSRSRLILCGAGHVSKAISYIAATMGFEIIVIDPRPEWANSQRFPDAKSIVTSADIEKSIKDQYSNKNTFYIIATWNHKHDREALKNIIYKEHKYIGMLASRKKAGEIINTLKEEGVEQSLLDKVYSPVGLDLKAETPEEIAISVMAEILMMKNNATGRSLSNINKLKIQNSTMSEL